MEVADIVAIQQLLGLYGHLIDDRDFARLGEVFSKDASFDATRVGAGVHSGLGEIQSWFRDGGTLHPPCHHTTNVYVWSDGDGTAQCISKSLTAGPSVGLNSGVYRDELVHTDEGWRIKVRTYDRRYAIVPPTGNPQTAPV
jgi:SnoaL-like protein